MEGVGIDKTELLEGKCYGAYSVVNSVNKLQGLSTYR